MTSLNAAPQTAQETWIPTASEFGTRLAMVRQHQGWNLTEASITCGLGQNDWARYEAGVSPRKLVEVVTKISDTTGVSANWLLWGPGEKITNRSFASDHLATVTPIRAAVA